MKKQIIILILFIIPFSSFSQVRTIKTKTPCTDEVLHKTPGKWFKNTGGQWQPGHIGLNASEQQQVSKRIELIHEMMLKIYPEPAGVDVTWSPNLGYSTFADKVKYVRNEMGDFQRETILEKPVALFSYTAGFFGHFCSTVNTNEIRLGYPNETGTWVHVFANSFAQATGLAQQFYEGHMTIDGYRVQMLQAFNKDLGGFSMLGLQEKTGNQRYVIIHRKGMLPYIPVTRKQYLEQCIPDVTRFWNEGIKNAEKMPVETFAVKEDKDEMIKKLKEEKEKVLRLYNEELERTTKDGLLDAPAIIESWFNPNLDNLVPIFVEETKGFMLVIENPNYMRKDLPKYVPQFFTVAWRWNDWSPQEDVAKLMEEKFPFTRLLEMIDK